MQRDVPANAPTNGADDALSKVPLATLAFWIVKILATTRIATTSLRNRMTTARAPPATRPAHP